MPWTEESLIRLALELPGGQLAADLRAKLVSVDGALRQLKDTYTAGSTPVDEYIARSSKLLRQQQDLTEQLGTLERAEREHAAAVANSAQGATAWGAAIAEGTRRATEASSADARLAAANRDLTTAFSQNAGSASSWGAAVAEGSRRAQELADRTARATGGLHAWDALMAQAPLTASRAASGTDAWVALMGKSATTTDTAGKSVDSLTKFLDKNKWGVLEAGRAVQDFSAAGLMGMVNNIERLVTGFGGTINLATTLTLVGVAAQALAPVFVSAFKSMFSEGVEPAANRLEELKRQLKELEEKPHKIAMDLLNIEYVQNEMRKLQDGLDAFEAAKNKRTSTHDKMGAAVSEAITEFAGAGDEATGVVNLKTTIRNIVERRGELGTFAAPGAEQGMKRLEKEIADMEGTIRAAASAGEDTGPIVHLQATLKDRLEKERAKFAADVEQGIANLIGDAMKGNESARAALERFFMRDRAAFRSAGIGDQFGAGVILASRANVEAGDRERIVIGHRKQADARDKVIADKKARDDAATAALAAQIRGEKQKQEEDNERSTAAAKAQIVAEKAAQEKKAAIARARAQRKAALDAKRELKSRPKRERQAKLAQVAQRAKSEGGANAQQAVAVAKRALQLHEGLGIPLQMAGNQAYFELYQQLISIEQKYAMMADQWGMNQQRMVTMRGTYIPYP